MSNFPQRRGNHSRVDASISSALTGDTTRAADSVVMSAGPFPVLPVQFGRYRIERLLGKGAMGAVYFAHDGKLDRAVALKVARVSVSGSARLIQRMETEAKAAAGIDHPQICKVHDLGEIDGIRFISLQYIEGIDLKSYLKREGRRREPMEAVQLILKIARALRAAHDKGVIHRDLKPGNVMINRDGEPVIMDFGLARRVTGSNDPGLTQGMILGTAAYMSPEQAIGIPDGIDHRSDLYALGVMLFEMLTGEWPFNGPAVELLGMKCAQPAPSPLDFDPAIPPQLAAVCRRLIAQRKEDRFVDCAELIAALETIDLRVSRELEASADSVQTTLDFCGGQHPGVSNYPEAQQTAVNRSISGSEKSRTVSSRMSPSPSMFLPSSWWSRQSLTRRRTIWGCGAAGGCLGLLAIVFFMKSGNALVRVEVHADDVEVTFQKESLTVADGTKKYTVRPGDQTLHIKSGDIQFDTKEFKLNRGNNPTVTVEIVNSEILCKFGDQQIGRRSLRIDPPLQVNPIRNAVTTEQPIAKQPRASNGGIFDNEAAPAKVDPLIPPAPDPQVKEAATPAPAEKTVPLVRPNIHRRSGRGR